MSKPGADFDACNDFFVLIVTCQVLTAAMSVLGMESLTDTPSNDVLPDGQNVWMMPDQDRKEMLTVICERIIDRCISFKFHDKANQSNDHVYEYNTLLLSIGCFYLEFIDAIREGDGDRVLMCWRYLLPIFKGAGRTNYSTEVLTMLCQYEFKFTPRMSQELIWSRFVNVHGIPGRNIAADLHMEHLNRLVKEAIRGLGVNKTEKAICRIGNSLGTLSPVLNQYDFDNQVSDGSAIRSIPGAERDRDMIITALKRANVFSVIESRSYPSFPKPKNLLQLFEYSKLVQWMAERIK